MKKQVDSVHMPQRRPNKSMDGIQLLTKAITGTHTKKSEKELKEEEAIKILNGRGN